MSWAGVEEKGGHQGPDSSGQEIVPAEHEIRVDEVRVLLPGPEAEAYTSQYEQIVYSQPRPCFERSDSQRPISEVPNYLRRLIVHFGSRCKGRLRQILLRASYRVSCVPSWGLESRPTLTLRSRR